MSVPKDTGPQFDPKVLRELHEANVTLPSIDLSPDPLLTYEQKKEAWPEYAPPSNISGLIAAAAGYIGHPSNYYQNQEQLDAAFSGLQHLIETFPTLTQQAINSLNPLTEDASGQLLFNMLKGVSTKQWHDATSDFPERDRPLTPEESDKLWKSIEPRMTASHTIADAALMAVGDGSEESKAGALGGMKTLVRRHLRTAHTALAFLKNRAEENEADDPKSAEQDRQAVSLVQAEIEAVEKQKKVGAGIGGLQGVRVAEHVAPTATGDMASPQRPVVTPTASTQRTV